MQEAQANTHPKKHTHTHQQINKDFHKEERENKETINFELPDGNIVCVGNARFMCPEALFMSNSQYLGREHIGIHRLVYDSIVMYCLGHILFFFCFLFLGEDSLLYSCVCVCVCMCVLFRVKAIRVAKSTKPHNTNTPHKQK